MMTKQESALAVLQRRWADHQDLRSGGASLAKLAASRAMLDAARLDAYRAFRRTLA